MRSFLMLLTPALVSLSVLAAQPQVPKTASPSSWRKTCKFVDVGGEGCDVSIAMSAKGLCPGGSVEYCVKIAVACPAGVPGGDVEETCENEICEICGPMVDALEILCDGQAFVARPKPGKTWGDVAKDCSGAVVTAHGRLGIA